MLIKEDIWHKLMFTEYLYVPGIMFGLFPENPPNYPVKKVQSLSLVYKFYKFVIITNCKMYNKFTNYKIYKRGN